MIRVKPMRKIRRADVANCAPICRVGARAKSQPATGRYNLIRMTQSFSSPHLQLLALAAVGIERSIEGMSSMLTVTRNVIGDGHMILTRSDGEVFNLMWLENGPASVFHDKARYDRVDLDISIMDKFAQVEKLILAYPTGWP